MELPPEGVKLCRGLVDRLVAASTWLTTSTTSRVWLRRVFLAA